MGKFLKKFNGVHLKKLLDIQRKGFNDLHMMNEHMNEENKKSILCYCKALGFCPGDCVQILSTGNKLSMDSSLFSMTRRPANCSVPTYVNQLAISASH